MASSAHLRALLTVTLTASLAGCSGGEESCKPRDGEGACAQFEPVSLAIVSAPTYLLRGQHGAVVVEATYPGNAVRDVTSEATWSSSTPGLLSISGGEITALGGGDVELTATVAGASDSVNIHVRGERFAFVTSGQGNGNFATWPTSGGLAGLAGADAICAEHARRAGLPGVFRAWLSDAANDAYCRIHGVPGKLADACGEASLPTTAGPWIRTDGLPFADGVRALVAGHILYPAEYDESARRLRPTYADYSVSANLYFTGTAPGGAFESGDCAGWTSDAFEEVTVAGVGGSGMVRWTRDSDRRCSEASTALLCLEVGEGAGPALETYAVEGKLAFVTSVGGPGNLTSWPDAGGAVGLAAADAICASRAAAAAMTGSFKAWLGNAVTTPDSRITADGPWVRSDGVLIAASRSELVGRRLRAPWVDEHGNGTDRGAWTGDDAPLGGLADCAGWENGGLYESGSSGVPADSGPMWAAWMTVGCASTFSLYCLEN